MAQPSYLTATLPLFETGEVDVIEWSFDMAWRPGLPDWLAGLIDDYARAGRLSGHGVSLSPLSSHPRQHAWFDRFALDAQRHRFTQVSEHFGFMAAGDFRLGPPMPLPLTAATLQVGRSHLERLRSLADAPVGLENLAFAFCGDDVWAQGEFLDALLDPVDGYLVLDVHNLWCQIVNFGADPRELLATYPLERVRECHVSGGSWSRVAVDGVDRTVRRDTHDAEVPDPVFDLLEVVLAECPNVHTVIVEQIGDAFATTESGERFRSDYRRVRTIAERNSAERTIAERTIAERAVIDRTIAERTIAGRTVIDRAVVDRASRRTAGRSAPGRSRPSQDRLRPPQDAVYPGELLRILDDATSPREAVEDLRRLDNDSATWNEWVGSMEPHMVATAQQLVSTWGRRSPTDLTTGW